MVAGQCVSFYGDERSCDLQLQMNKLNKSMAFPMYVVEYATEKKKKSNFCQSGTMYDINAKNLQ